MDDKKVAEIQQHTSINHFMSMTVEIDTYKVYEWVMEEARNAAAGYREFEGYESSVEGMVRLWVEEHIEWGEDRDYTLFEEYSLPILCAYGHAMNAVNGAYAESSPFDSFLEDIVENALEIIQEQKL